MNKNAFSLVELLITLAIIAIIGAVIMNTYNGIQNSAIAVAQQKDTAELNQVMAQLHMSGGNLAAILDPTQNGGAAMDTQAYALTYLLQNPLNQSSLTQKGTVGGNVLSTGEIVIPYPYAVDSNGNPVDDGRNRIVFSTTGVPTIKGVGNPGFFAVNINSTEGKYFSIGGQYYNSKHYKSGLILVGAGTTGGAAQSNLAGSKYAASNSYVWNEDATIQPSPNGGNGTSVLLPTIEIAYAYGNGRSDGLYNLADYKGSEVVGQLPANGASSGIVYFYAFRSDGGDLMPGDVSFTATLGASGLPPQTTPGPATVVAAGTLATGVDANGLPYPASLGSAAGLGTNKGLLWTLNLNSAFPATNVAPSTVYWPTSASQNVNITASVAANYNQNVIQPAPTITPLPLPLDSPPANTVTVSSGGSIPITIPAADSGFGSVAIAGASDPDGTVTDTPTSVTDATASATDSFVGTVDGSGDLNLNLTSTTTP